MQYNFYSFLDSALSASSSSSCVDLCQENSYKNKENKRSSVTEAHFSNIKNNSDINSKSLFKHRTQQGRENKVIKGSCVANTKIKPRSFSLTFQGIKPTSNTSKEGSVEKRKTTRSTKADTTSTVLALYGADIDYKGYNKMSSDCIVQRRVSYRKLNE